MAPAETNETGGGSTGGGSTGGGTTSTTGDSTGQLEISMRDAPIDDVSELWVYVSGLKVKPAGEPVIRVETNTGLYNLLALTDGVTADLALVEVPAGTYQFIEILLDQDRELRGRDGDRGEATAADRQRQGEDQWWALRGPRERRHLRPVRLRRRKVAQAEGQRRLAAQSLS